MLRKFLMMQKHMLKRLKEKAKKLRKHKLKEKQQEIEIACTIT